jgi:hypothetical protein
MSATHEAAGVGRRELTHEPAHEPLPLPAPGPEELVMHLERDQLVEETERPVPRAELSLRATAGLWLLRAFAVIVGLMVVYTFFAQLH